MQLGHRGFFAYKYYAQQTDSLLKKTNYLEVWKVQWISKSLYFELFILIQYFDKYMGLYMATNKAPQLNILSQCIHQYTSNLYAWTNQSRTSLSHHQKKKKQSKDLMFKNKATESYKV